MIFNKQKVKVKVTHLI